MGGRRVLTRTHTADHDGVGRSCRQVADAYVQGAVMPVPGGAGDPVSVEGDSAGRGGGAEAEGPGAACGEPAERAVHGAYPHRQERALSVLTDRRCRRGTAVVGKAAAGVVVQREGAAPAGSDVQGQMGR